MIIIITTINYDNNSSINSIIQIVPINKYINEDAVMWQIIEQKLWNDSTNCKHQRKCIHGRNRGYILGLVFFCFSVAYKQTQTPNTKLQSGNAGYMATRALGDLQIFKAKNLRLCMAENLCLIFCCCRLKNINFETQISVTLWIG